jgi:DNA-binding cell septation regulator SpoVG
MKPLEKEGPRRRSASPSQVKRTRLFPSIDQSGPPGKEIEVSVRRIRPVTGHGNLRAFADVRIGQITLFCLRVIQQPGQRPWVSLPQVIDAEGHYRPVARCDDEELKARIRAAVLRAWAAHKETIESAHTIDLCRHSPGGDG